jgi:hypothetical protein
METILNLVWLAITLGIAAVWSLRWLPARRHPRRRAVRDAVALGCALALLFPAISLTDDLHPAIVAVDAASGKRNACQFVAQLAHARTASGRALTNPAAAVVLPRGFTGCEFASSDLVTAADELNASSHSTHSSGRSPPAAFV